MPANNTKLLTKRELKNLKDRYYFCLNESGTKIIVGNKYYKRETYHPISEGFSLNSKVRIIRLSKEAIKIWLELEQKYNLFEIQQVINILKMMLQEANATLVKKLLDKNILDRLED